MGLCHASIDNPRRTEADWFMQLQKPKIEVTEDAIKDWEWKKLVRKETKKNTRQSSISVGRKRGGPREVCLWGPKLVVS